MSTEFGAFLKKKRQTLGISQRIFARITGISYSYISSLETGKRPAPSRDVLIRMEEELRLTPKEKVLFEQLAAKTKPEPTVSYNIADYINKNETVYNTVAFAQRNDIAEEDWQEFLKKIKGKYF